MIIKLYWQKSEDELKSLWMNVKEEVEKAGLKLNIKKIIIRSWDQIPSFYGR